MLWGSGSSLFCRRRWFSGLSKSGQMEGSRIRAQFGYRLESGNSPFRNTRKIFTGRSPRAWRARRALKPPLKFKWGSFTRSKYPRKISNSKNKYIFSRTKFLVSKKKCWKKTGENFRNLRKILDFSGKFEIFSTFFFRNKKFRSRKNIFIFGVGNFPWTFLRGKSAQLKF